MALRRPTVEEMLNRKIPEGAELVYISDELDQGGPLVVVYREMNVSAEERAENRERIQDALLFAARQIAEQESNKHISN